MIKNLKQFLAWRGCGDSPYSWARAFYKYTDCGPWVVFLMRDGPDIYYEDIGKDETERKTERCGCYLKPCGPHPDDPEEEVYQEGEVDPDCRACRGSGSVERDRPTGRKVTVAPDLCVGIKFGSIVEGSEQESGPYEHLFPISKTAWNRDMKHMEEETSYYWKRDNATWYAVRTEDDAWIVADVWGDLEWEDDTPPEPIKLAAEEAIRKDWQPDPRFKGAIIQTIPKMPSTWVSSKESDKNWKALPLGDTGAEIYTFTNDGEF